MPKILILSVLFLRLSSAWSQSFLITVTGSVTYSDGTPVEGVDIFISSVFDDSTFYFANVLTDANGVYDESIAIPDGQSFGTISVSAIGCNGMFDYATLTWDLNVNVLVQDFVWCEIVDISDSCFVLILPSYDLYTGLTTLYALSSALEPVTYLWNDGSTTQSIIPIDTGTYCVTITGVDSCTASGCYEYVSGGEGCFVSISSSNGGFVDSVLVAIGYGAEPITYVWNTGDTGQTIVVHDEGTYCVTMTDASDCSTDACIYYYPVLCYAWIGFDPSGGLSVYAEGSGPFAYLWSTGDTTETILPSESGYYCVTVTDAEDCISETCYDYYLYCDVFLSYGTDSLNGVLSDVLLAYCYGIPPFSYAWSTGDTTESITIDSLIPGICVTVTDATGCVDSTCTDELLAFCYAWISVAYETDSTAILTATGYPFMIGGSMLWSNGDSTESITVSDPGEYCVEVQNAFSCSATACAYVDFVTNYDSCYAYIWAYQDPLTGLYTFEAGSTGIAPFTFQWSTGDTAAIISIAPPDTALCVVVTDATGCASESCILTIDYSLCQVWIDAYPVDSSTWSLTAYVPDFIEPASYLWNTGETSSTIVATSGAYCVTITTYDGCTSSTCLYLNISCGDTLNSNGVIHGYVFTEDQASLTGTVELYQVVDPATGTEWILIDTATIESDNFYFFSDVSPGIYAVRAIAQTVNGTQAYFPTYYYHNSQWQEANIITIPNNLTVLYDIQLIPTTVMNGPGVIMGAVVDPDGILSPLHSPLRTSGLGGIQIMLLDSQGFPLAFVYTDMHGDFNFDDLPWGEYRLRFEAAGIHSPEIWVILSPENPAVTSVIISASEFGHTGVSELNQGILSVFPQPAINTCRVLTPTEITGEHALMIVTLNGQIVQRFYNVFAQSTETSLDISDLSTGMYIVRLESEQGFWISKLIAHTE